MGSIGPSLAPLGKRLKTVDWGSNGTLMSLDQRGTFLQLSKYHACHGIVSLSVLEQFDGNEFHNPAYVRSYRARILDYVRDDKPGFGLQVQGDPMGETKTTKHRQGLELSYETRQGVHVHRTITLAAEGTVQQTTFLSTTEPAGVSVTIKLDLGMSLNRASYGQLTEGGPIPIPESLNIFQIKKDGSKFSLRNPNLNSTVIGSFSTEYASPMDFDDSEQQFRQEPVTAQGTAVIKLMPNAPVTLTLSFLLRPENSFVMPENGLDAGSVSPPSWKVKDPVALNIIHGNLEYVLGNCMVPISESSICFITDHVALPLGWNRDNYWQVRFLMEAYRHIGRIADASTAEEYRKQIYNSVKGHLNWVFHDAQRPQRFWHRSYLATGVPKDGPVFQLDQQCYPIIELCDALEYIPGLESFAKSLLQESTIPDIIGLLCEKRDPSTGLFPTDETPGDDPVEFPFHFSSHVLVWHTCERLSKALNTLGDTDRINASQLDSLANEVRDAAIKHFVAPNPKSQKRMFAYLTDGSGNHSFYHDANDIPTLFAREWGFCDSELRSIWAETLHFGLSPANVGGFYGGTLFGGLGSVHTRGPWPLGYFQELVFAEMQGDADARAQAWEKIKGTCFFDGMFSEAVDKTTGECTSKAWFSWPGCMIGSALLQDRSGKVLCEGLQ